ncbi:MAG: lipid-A-disaccharide synthase [Deltaproteobacteria bacterium]|nr:lipid-A-disaccharide synthase [Deltaproteobacteria bacterium]
MNPAPQSTPKVLIVAGEASGDLHASEVARAIQRAVPGVRLYGVGGDAMRRAGVDVIHDSSRLAVVGLFEVLTKIVSIWRLFRSLVRGFTADRPSLAILIDSPDFNLRVAKRLARLRVPVLYFIGPQVWAWRAGRLALMRRIVSRTAVVFPFEEAIYRDAEVPVSFVGHPLLDRIEAPADLDKERALARERLGIPDGAWVTLMPGSRRSEVSRILPRLVQTAARLAGRSVRFLLPLAPGLSRSDVEQHLARSPLPIRIVEDATYDCLRAADAAIVASGTATLEAALLGTPMVVVYRLNPLTYWFARRVVRVDHIAMANILAGRRLVPELVQGAATPARIAREVERFLDEPTYARSTRNDLLALREKLGSRGVAGRVAGIATSLLSGP